MLICCFIMLRTQKFYYNAITLSNKKCTAVEPQHLKVKVKDISLTKNYCITISIQKISSIHNSFFKYSRF